MEAFFDFLGGYWWLAFPLMGVVAPLGSWWSKNQKERHERRLEVMRTKAELAQARPADPRQLAEDEAAGRQRRVARLLEAHDDVARRWLDYELDPAKLIAFPAMSDGRDPRTAAFLRAKRVADGLRPASADERIDAETYAEYRDAVHDAEVAFDVAEQEARRVRDSGFTETERQRLARAQQLLSVALDQSATAAERQSAYRRVRDELDGLIVLSDDAVAHLKHRIAGELSP
ncbi:hypothetical protein [Microbacterium excoecariae]|uniref:hypothetical protein n=1 Tax=Microbacterium excoecariae TaxID=2715210 RepID=UPI00140B9125|nr:hypothetical protein [Microbacterium excoecariae]NHI15955.1 hypothetical protein [Microbacterium excoecariae]